MDGKTLRYIHEKRQIDRQIIKEGWIDRQIDRQVEIEEIEMDKQIVKQIAREQKENVYIFFEV